MATEVSALLPMSPVTPGSAAWNDPLVKRGHQMATFFNILDGVRGGSASAGDYAGLLWVRAMVLEATYVFAILLFIVTELVDRPRSGGRLVRNPLFTVRLASWGLSIAAITYFLSPSLDNNVALTLVGASVFFSRLSASENIKAAD
eukprot:TRINITY_DN17759_c0_g1_i1.p1 TRINITY_DN17759_c0_g1~~TRINITY_DN17759_c0_g1_i1.p1  ORF type:complete len:164 (+),score=56.17 TRINITY_DN17759_c0_g1_i1:57-494(+)